MDELEPKTNIKTMTTSEVEPSSETLSRSPCVVMYGQTEGYYGGATGLSEALKTYLGDHGMSDERVILSRNTDNIEDAFYRGRRMAQPAENVMPVAEKRGRLRSLLGALSLRRNKPAVLPVPNSTLVDETAIEARDTIPTAVFVFSKMREYWNGNGSTVNTPVEKIRALCLENGVPMVIIGEGTTQKELKAAISELPPLPNSHI